MKDQVVCPCCFSSHVSYEGDNEYECCECFCTWSEEKRSCLIPEPTRNEEQKMERDMIMACRKFTVVYEIVDEAEWGKSNPLGYQHDGLKAEAASLGDALLELEKAEDIIEAARNEIVGHDEEDECDCPLCKALLAYDGILES